MRTNLPLNTTITHRYIWQLAMPMILANISVPLLGIVDTAVMGHLDSASYLAAVALGSIIFSFLFWGFGFLRMATTGLTAQASSQKSETANLVVLRQGVFIAIVIAIGLLALQSPLKQLCLSLLGGSEQVQHYAQVYFDIRIWSSPAILINYVILGWLIGMAKTRHALYQVLMVNISNMILSVVLVYGLNMTVDGVALASVIAEYLGLMLGLYLIGRERIRYLLQRPNTALLKQLSDKHWLQLNANIFIRTLCLMFCFSFFTAQGAKQGDIILAANALLLNFLTFLAFVMDGFANAVEIIAGKAVGANNKQMLRRGLKLTLIWSAAMACVFSLAYFLFGPLIIASLSSIDDVQQTANIYLIWLIIMPLIAVWSYVFDGLFIGCTLSQAMRNTMLFSTLCCYLPAWYFSQTLGNHGLWLALALFLMARGISQAVLLPKIIRLDVGQKTSERDL